MTFLRSRCLALVLILAAIPMLGQQPVAPDPPGLQMQFRSAAGSNRFRVGEVIPIEILVSSTSPDRYLEPCALFRETNFGFPQCRFFSKWSFGITPETGWLDYTKFGGPGPGGGPSFAVPNHTLTAEPETFPYFLTNRFRFDRPGQYKIRFTLQVGLNDASNHVGPPFPGPQDQPKRDSVSITRELVLEIVPAEAEWQEEIVRKGAEAWLGPPPLETNPPSPKLLQYQEARRALCALGTPEAAQALAKALLLPDFEAQSCLERSPNLSAGIDEMQRLLVDPDSAVNSNFFSALVRFRAIDERKKTGVPSNWQELIDSERYTLFASLQQKRGSAQVTSLVTVLTFPPRAADGGQNLYDLPFPPAVIAAAAANFDRLPAQTTKLLLADAWDRIRSPLMLTPVRRMAEAGDGPALLRWQELEPVAAAEFIRNEIVRPQPRFSSHYLRRPEASLPGQERQIAANFAALATLNDNPDLVHSASLLHRYATRTVLPTVLPFIDANLTEWPCSIQVPVLAYLLKVSPREAAPRVEKVLNNARIQICASRLLTTLGVLEPGPALQRLALAQIEAGAPAADDGADYLRQHAPPDLKPTIWAQLQRWYQISAASGAEKRMHDGVVAAITNDDRAKHYLVVELMSAFEAAQGWVLTPEDERRLRTLLGEDNVRGMQCRFSCGGSLSVGPGAQMFRIVGRQHPTEEERANTRESMEYLNSPERLRYSINQYSCADLKAFKNKLLQFPAGSTFAPYSGFSASDRDELKEIRGFLTEHGYKVSNPQDWALLGAAQAK
jgi:hypothetical protein